MQERGPSRIDSRQLTVLVLLIMLLVLLLATLLFFPPYLESFVGDDFVQHWRIRKLLDTPLQSPNVFRPDWTDWYYRPLQHLWFLGNRLVFGLTPAGYYFLQLLCHLLSISLVFSIARKLGLGSVGALISAAIFAISAEHQLTVDWISSVGVVAATSLSLGAVAVFLSYLKNQQRWYFLLFTLFFWMAALTFHEASILFPFVLLSIWWLYSDKRASSLKLIAFASATVIVTILYVYIQLTRKNANLGADSVLAVRLQLNELLSSAGKFTLRSLSGWLGLEQYGSRILDTYRDASAAFLIIFALAVAGLIMLYRWGSKALRLGIIWMSFHLGFILAVLWIPRPDLMGGRHLYTPWVGAALAVGAALDQVLNTPHRRKPIILDRNSILISTVVLVFIFAQTRQVLHSQSSTLALTELVHNLAIQTKTILPEVSENTRVFASRFVLSPSYFPPTAAVWYGKPFLTGGDLSTLKKYPFATSDFYIFDYDEGEMSNLMPEVQNHNKSFFLWKADPAITELSDTEIWRTVSAEVLDLHITADSTGEKMYSVVSEPSGSNWISLAYEVSIPEGANLEVSILPQPNLEYRIKLRDKDGFEHTLKQEIFNEQEKPIWRKISVPLNSSWDQSATIFLESRFRSLENENPVSWGNPRLVVD